MLRKHLLTSALALSFLSMTVASCGGSGGDATTKFVGPWTFQSGELGATCLGMMLSPFSLKGLPVDFSKIDDSTISLMINTGCNIKFHVSGSMGTAVDKQTCTLDLGGSLGTQNISIQKWTLVLSGDRIDNDIAGSASICTAAGTAVLVRGASDAGVPDGGHDAAAGHDGSASDAGGTDGGAADTASDAGADGAADASSDGAADADGGQPD